jgi:RNase H-fold protein (predicted Holliday junction resolvase)
LAKVLLTLDKVILSIDPGKKKCGLAVVDDKLRFITGTVVNNEELANRTQEYVEKYLIKNIAIGSGTNSENIINLIKEKFPDLLIMEVAEKDTTRQARKYYFEYYPPTGLLKFIPVSLLIPPRPYDDFAAYVIARRFFHDFKEANSY